MADELDRKLIPELMQTTFTLSLGACYKSIEMIKDPQNSAEKVFTEVKEMFTIPKDAGEGLEKKAQAVAAVWMEKGATLMESCKNAGEQFTEEKEEK